MAEKLNLTLASLFDGIGGFPYAASFFGIETLWGSEIMPGAISVTKRHLPHMEHVGDITKIHGDKLPPVDIITLGSPCQGLSLAGKRFGLADPRSGLFAEAIRIINEMREATNGRYPTWAIWENVPGALSSNKGLDYKAVLEAFTEAEIPFPRSGKWANAGMVRGGRADVAWVIYNSQHFGTAQRRRRIFLVADFGGRRAGEILFIPKSLRGYFETGGTPRQGFAAYAQGGAGGASISASEKDIAATIFAGYGNHWNGNAGAYDGGNFALTQKQNCLTAWDVQSRRIHDEDGVWPALYGGDGGGHGYVQIKEADAVGFDGYNGDLTGDKAATLGVNCGMSTGRNGVLDKKPVAFVADAPSNCLTPWDNQQARIYTEDGKSPTLAGADGGGGRNPGGLVFAAFLGGAGEKARSIGYSEEVSPTLKAGACGFMAPCLCEPKLCTVINDQGGGSLNIEKSDISPTLRSETHGNLPIVSLCAVGVHQNQSGDINTADTAYSLATNGNASGRNAPLVFTEIHAFSLDGVESNSMKSKNTDSGCREVDTARTIDTTYPCPSKNQGGIAIVHSANALNVHPDISGTLCASGAGLSRPAGMASETDLCVAYCLQGNMIGRKDENGPAGSGVNENVSFCLNCVDQHAVTAPESEPIPINDKATRYSGGGDTRRGDGSGNGLGVGQPGDPAPTITAGDRHMVATVFSQQRSDAYRENEIASTQTAHQSKDATDLVCSAVDCRNFRETEELSGTLQAKGSPGYSLNCQNPVRLGYIVRRLTPTECERLQGYGDGWTEYGHDGKAISDTARYQMLGNSIAVPCVAYIMLGIARAELGLPQSKTALQSDSEVV